MWQSNEQNETWTNVYDKKKYNVTWMIYQACLPSSNVGLFSSLTIERSRDSYAKLISRLSLKF
jgi:hypothetical protein